MIHINNLHEQFRDSVNRLNSNYNKTFAVSTIDSYLNRSQDVIVERLMTHVEKSTKVRNHLRILEKKEVSLDIIDRKEGYVVAGFPKDYYRLLRQNAFVVTKDCPTERQVAITTVSSDKLSETLGDPYWKPDFFWKETVADEAGNGYYVYKDPDWTVNKVIVDYLRKPKRMAAFNLSGCTAAKPYVTAEGQVIKSDRHFELSGTYLWRYVADLAAFYALRDLGQVDDAKTKMEEMIFTEIMKV